MFGIVLGVQYEKDKISGRVGIKLKWFESRLNKYTTKTKD